MNTKTPELMDTKYSYILIWKAVKKELSISIMRQMKKPSARLKKQIRNGRHIANIIPFGEAKNYDVCLNSGILGIDQCVKIIKGICGE